MIHRFYNANTLLFRLEAATEYDTATPYRYAVSRFAEVARLIRGGKAVTVISQSSAGEKQAILCKADDLWQWLSEHFNGFERHVS